MRIHLINPPAYEGVMIVREGRCMQRRGAWTAVWSPISLALTAAVLLEDGHDVRLNDCIVEEVDRDRLVHLVREFAPELVLVNTATPSISSDLAVVDRLRKELPGAVIGVFGIHPTVLAEQCFQLAAGLDFAVRGEPELAMRDLANALLDDRDPASIPGITYRRNGELAHGIDRAPVESLDELPFPAWHLVQRELYRMPFTDEQFLLVATGRGCPYFCRFCSDTAFYGHRLAIRTPARVVDEMAWIERRFGINSFLFWSEAFTINRRYALAVAEELIRRGSGFRWVCNSRVDNVDPELLSAFKRAGCWMIGYGIEAGTQAVLDRMNKGTTLQQAEQAVRWTREAGMDVTAHCVVGYPGETPQEMEETLRFVTRLDVDFAQFYCAVPFPGSELYREARQKGWICDSRWEHFEQNFSVLTTPSLTAEQVMNFRHRAYRSFYLRPRMVWRTIRRIRNLRQLRRFLAMSFDFLTWL